MSNPAVEMTRPTDFDVEREAGILVHNMVHFSQALRRGGLPVGPSQVLGSVRAISVAGFSSRDDFFWILRSCFVAKREHREIFAQIFRLYWRDPRFLERMMAALTPMTRGVQQERLAEAAARRASEALLNQQAPPMPTATRGSEDELEIGIDASGTTTSLERLQQIDFEQMSSEEMAEADQVIANLKLDISPIPSRRKQRVVQGQSPDWRQTMRRAVSSYGEVRQLAWRDPKWRWPNLVVLCDISGSMAVYSRTLLRFLHAVTNRKLHDSIHIHAFTFGTRLTNISRHLANSDADVALKAVGMESPDWEGGTRIGECLREFNVTWSRRVMSQGAITLLISDGLDGGGCSKGLLAREMSRLRLSSRRLVWINPLLRWSGFLPKARGVQEMLPNVDCFRSAHNIVSLRELGLVLNQLSDSGEKQRLMALLYDDHRSSSLAKKDV